MGRSDSPLPDDWDGRVSGAEQFRPGAEGVLGRPHGAGSVEGASGSQAVGEYQSATQGCVWEKSEEEGRAECEEVVVYPEYRRNALNHGITNVSNHRLYEVDNPRWNYSSSKSTLFSFGERYIIPKPLPAGRLDTVQH